MIIRPGGGTLGARVDGVDLAQVLSPADFATVLEALGDHGVLCFPAQSLKTEEFVAFGRRFGELAVNIANRYHEPGFPEVMILSNMADGTQPLGLADAGQDWHTDQSNSRDVSLANILLADRVPQRDGVALGNTEFLNMHAAYEELPDTIKTRLNGMSAIHDFEKFWEAMRARPGSQRPRMTAEQKSEKPPVAQPIFRTHPLTGGRVLYCNPGYAIRIDGMTKAESDDMLAFLFAHQMRDEFRHAHSWSEGDLLIWDNIGTVHRAVADYGSDEHRYMRRIQVMATGDYATLLDPPAP